MGSFNFNEKKMPKVKRSTQKGGPSLSKSGENQVEMYKKEMDTNARNVLCTIIPEKLDYLCRILDQEMWQPEYSLKAREFCINSIGEYVEKVKEIEELKKLRLKRKKQLKKMSKKMLKIMKKFLKEKNKKKVKLEVRRKSKCHG